MVLPEACTRSWPILPEGGEAVGRVMAAVDAEGSSVLISSLISGAARSFRGGSDAGSCSRSNFCSLCIKLAYISQGVPLRQIHLQLGTAL